MRDFVCDLEAAREGSPQLGLQLSAEERLQNEIDCHTTHVVQGDGTESSAKKHDISPTELLIKVDEVADIDEHADKDSDGEGESSSRNASWVTPGPWPSPPSTPDMARRDTNRSLPARRRAASSASTWSSFSALPPQSHLPTPTLRRVQSRPHLPRKHDLASTHPPSREYRVPVTSMSPCTTPVPRPLIRRSHSSHPDITSLCAEWANHGPANQTLTFRPDLTAPRRRKFSLDRS